jgi:hypothetical protein
LEGPPSIIHVYIVLSVVSGLLKLSWTCFSIV